MAQVRTFDRHPAKDICKFMVFNIHSGILVWILLRRAEVMGVSQTVTIQPSRHHGAALVPALASLVIAGLGAQSIVAILIAAVLIDVAIQAVDILNQTRLLAVDPAARSRLNAAFVTCNFIGGEIERTTSPRRAGRQASTLRRRTVRRR